MLDRNFAHMFCATQQIARCLAQEFNEKLSSLPRVHSCTPRVALLDCSIYQVFDFTFGHVSLLVEERLDESKWHKWNRNDGYVEGMKSAPRFSQETLRRQMAKLSGLDDIHEEEEDEEEESESDHEAIIRYTPSHLAQAFSHFSYWATGRKRLVCDLQGLYCSTANLLKLSDPVIHYYDHLREDRRQVHGRADCGRKGIAKFFESHVCSALCKLMIRGLKFIKSSRAREKASMTWYKESRKGDASSTGS